MFRNRETPLSSLRPITYILVRSPSLPAFFLPAPYNRDGNTWSRTRPPPSKLPVKHLTKTSLWCVAGTYLLFRTYQSFRQPSPDASWFTRYGLIILAGGALISAFESYRDGQNGQHVIEPRAEPLTRGERIVFKALGLPVILVGLALLGLAGWMAWGQWVKVARWPRTNAILISKDISSVGARLVFRYEAKAQRFTGVGFRFGSEKSVRKALAAYEPGTIQKIAYDPEDPTQVETMLSDSWKLFMGSIYASVFGIVFLVGGVIVYRWSYDRFRRSLAA